MRDDFSRTADVKNFEDVVDHNVSFTPGEIEQTCSSRGKIVQIYTYFKRRECPTLGKLLSQCPSAGVELSALNISYQRSDCNEYSKRITCFCTFWEIDPEAVPQVHDVQVSELIALGKRSDNHRYHQHQHHNCISSPRSS